MNVLAITSVADISVPIQTMFVCLFLLGGRAEGYDWIILVTFSRLAPFVVYVCVCLCVRACMYFVTLLTFRKISYHQFIQFGSFFKYGTNHHNPVNQTEPSIVGCNILFSLKLSMLYDETKNCTLMLFGFTGYREWKIWDIQTATSML